MDETNDFLRRFYNAVDAEETFFVPKIADETMISVQSSAQSSAQSSDRISAQNSDRIPDQIQAKAQIYAQIPSKEPESLSVIAPERYDSEDLHIDNMHFNSQLFNIFNNNYGIHEPIIDNDPKIMFGGGINVNVDVGMEIDLCGSHKIIKVDVSHLYNKNIELPTLFIDKVNEQLKIMKALKIQFGVITEWAREDERKLSTFSNSAKELTDTFISDGISELKTKIESMAELGSNWQLVRIIEIFFILTKVSDICRLSGSSYIETPQSLHVKNAIVNVKNKDLNCFLYSVLSLTKKTEIVERLHRVTSYLPFITSLKYKNIVMPMKLKDIRNFEAQNPGLAINVMTYSDTNVVNIHSDEDENAGLKHPFVDIIHKTRVVGVEPIYLLLLQKDDKFHYTAVHSMQRLLNIKNTTFGRRIRSLWCTRCLNGFYSAGTLEKHRILCMKNELETTLYTLPKNKFLYFKDWSKTVTPAFVLYADFESILPKDEKHHQIHRPIAAGCLLYNNYTGEKVYSSFIGENCVLNFLEYIESIIGTIILPFHKNFLHAPMNPLDADDLWDFNNSEKCYLCKRKSNPLMPLVRDHCHFSGNYKGAACNKCNLSRKIRKSLSVVFHNLKGYDMHHILKYGLGHFKKWTIECLPSSTEKYNSLFVTTQGLRIRFIDSLAFLNDSLKEAVKTLTTTPITTEMIGNAAITCSKGIFPYDYATSLEVLQNTESLPPIWDEITPEEYAEAESCWTAAGCESLLDYMMIYLKLDVTLLADVFQQFRQKSMYNNRLDPVNFFGVPGLSWASALMTLKKPVELLQDMSMYEFFEAGIRGGMTFVNKHHVKASENVQIMYIDINNLYGHALSQYLPRGDFKWVYEEDKLQKVLDIINSNCDISEWNHGYYVEVDITIPQSVHDKLDELPLAPEKMCPPGSKQEKLLLTHLDKNNYPGHWRTIQLYVQLGAVVTKIHRAVYFSQAPIFESYVNFNTVKRSQATNEMDRNFFKLLNNSVYGKTVENLRRRMNLRLCNNKTRLMTYTSKVSFQKSIKIDEDLISVLLNKENICLDRPSYIGQAVLDLSKICMYELKYKILASYETRFGCKIRIVAGDTDSFFLEVENVDVVSTLIPAMIADGHLDTSNYDKEHSYYSERIASKIGKFKDETKGRGVILEGIFLCPKSYSVLTTATKEKERNIKKAKGIRLKGSIVDHDSYVKVYEEDSLLSIPQSKIESKNHQLYTIKSNKKALRCFDNKRCWLGKNESVAYGHYRDNSDYNTVNDINNIDCEI